MQKIQKALISVSDKNGIIDFAKELISLGVEIISTGGTAKALRENNINVTYISDYTGFPEILEGRVKTLHPKVHSGLLADLSKDSHKAELEQNGIDSIDILVVNLYPFELTLEKNPDDHQNLIENIDIGGPAMLRAAAKNYLHTLPVVDPEDYSRVIDALKSNQLNEDLRTELAAKVFEHTSRYDTIISNYLNKKTNRTKKYLSVNSPKVQDLRYGENPHQNATAYGKFDGIFDKLHGKELSYNNLLDLDASLRLIKEFHDPTAVIVKHTNPCGIGRDSNLAVAFQKAFATDTVSPFGGIFTFNRKLDIETVKAFDDIFSEVIIAPDYEDDAFELLSQKKNRRLIKYNQDFNIEGTDIRSAVFGFLEQERDLLDTLENINIVTKRSPNEQELDALKFAWKVCKHVKSNAIVYTRHDRTLGIGAGQMSRVDSSRIAVEKAKLMGLNLEGSVVASDAFFPFADGLIEAAKVGVTAVIQPGGSVRDEEVIKAADENNIAMIFTGHRHFKH